jgi:hypothetical protein
VVVKRTFTTGSIYGLEVKIDSIFTASLNHELVMKIITTTRL